MTITASLAQMVSPYGKEDAYLLAPQAQPSLNFHLDQLSASLAVLAA